MAIFCSVKDMPTEKLMEFLITNNGIKDKEIKAVLYKARDTRDISKSR